MKLINVCVLFVCAIGSLRAEETKAGDANVADFEILSLKDVLDQNGEEDSEQSEFNARSLENTDEEGDPSALSEIDANDDDDKLEEQQRGFHWTKCRVRERDIRVVRIRWRRYKLEKSVVITWCRQTGARCSTREIPHGACHQFFVRVRRRAFCYFYRRNERIVFRVPRCNCSHHDNWHG